MRRLLGVADVKFNVICAFERQEIFLRRRSIFLFWSSNCCWHNDLLTLSRRAHLLNIRSTSTRRKVVAMPSAEDEIYFGAASFGASEAAIFSNRGSPRNGSQKGSRRNRP